jgi:hypothetical protein
MDPHPNAPGQTPTFLQSLLAENLNVLSEAGIAPSAADSTQLARSIRILAERALPPGIRAAALSQGAFAGPEALGTFEQLAHYEGSWGCGNLGGVLPPEPYYEEQPGEIYNAPGPQALVGGFGFRPLDPRMADMGIWIPRDRYVPGDVLWIRAFGRIRQSDAGPRTFSWCLDPNGLVGAKQNPWGSNDAIVLACTVPPAQFPQRVPACWDVVMVYVAEADQLVYSQLSVPTRQVISGKRYQSGPGFLQTWGADLLGGGGWNFVAPPVTPGHADWLGNTLLGTRWAVSGTQNNVAVLSFHTLDAYVSRNRFA